MNMLPVQKMQLHINYQVHAVRWVSINRTRDMDNKYNYTHAIKQKTNVERV